MVQPGQIASPAQNVRGACRAHRSLTMLSTHDPFGGHCCLTSLYSMYIKSVTFSACLFYFPSILLLNVHIWIVFRLYDFPLQRMYNPEDLMPKNTWVQGAPSQFACVISGWAGGEGKAQHFFRCHEPKILKTIRGITNSWYLEHHYSIHKDIVSNSTIYIQTYIYIY